MKKLLLLALGVLGLSYFAQIAAQNHNVTPVTLMRAMDEYPCMDTTGNRPLDGAMFFLQFQNNTADTLTEVRLDFLNNNADNYPFETFFYDKIVLPNELVSTNIQLRYYDGIDTISLKILRVNGTNTNIDTARIKAVYPEIESPISSRQLPYKADFEGGNLNDIKIASFYNKYSHLGIDKTWEIENNLSAYGIGDKCLGLRAYESDVNDEMFIEFFQNTNNSGRIGQYRKDEIILPLLNLINVDKPKLIFDLAFPLDDESNAIDFIAIEGWESCTKVNTARNIISYTDINPIYKNNEGGFIPENYQWKRVVVDLYNFKNRDEVRLKIVRNNATLDRSSNMFIDNIEVVDSCLFGFYYSVQPQVLDTICPENKTQILTIEPVSYQDIPFTYEWSVNNDSSVISNSFRATTAGIYSLTSTENHSNCVNEYELNLLPLTPEVNITRSIDNHTAIANVSTMHYPFTYLWSNGETTSTLTNVITSGMYTVTVTDRNGCTGIDSVEIFAVGVDQIQDVTDFKVFPNPNNGTFNVIVAYDNAQAFEIIVTDILGRIIETQHFEAAQANITMNLNHQTSGIYFVSLKTQDKVSTQKVVITR